MYNRDSKRESNNATLLKKRQRECDKEDETEFNPPSTKKIVSDCRDEYDQSGKKKRGRKPGTKNGEGAAKKAEREQIRQQSLNPEESPEKKKRGRKPGQLNQKTIVAK